MTRPSKPDKSADATEFVLKPESGKIRVQYSVMIDANLKRLRKDEKKYANFQKKNSFVKVRKPKIHEKKSITCDKCCAIKKWPRTPSQ